MGKQHIFRRLAIRFPGLKNSSPRHEVQFYSADSILLESCARFIATALEANNAVIVILTQPHREGLAQKLHARGFDIDRLMQLGTYISLDAVDMLWSIMRKGVADRVRFFDGLCDLIESASKAEDRKHKRVALCAECVGLLCAEGNTSVALQLEETGSDLIELYDVDILCAYPLDGFQNGEGGSFESICKMHTAVYSQ